MLGNHSISQREKRLQDKEQKWSKEKELIERENLIKEEQKALKPKRLTTAKLLVFFLFLNCTLIEVFTAYVTIKSFELAMMTGGSVELAPLVALIGAIVGEVIGYAIYSLKAMKENTAGGITYETAMADLEPKG